MYLVGNRLNLHGYVLVLSHGLIGWNAHSFAVTYLSAPEQDESDHECKCYDPPAKKNGKKCVLFVKQMCLLE